MGSWKYCDKYSKNGKRHSFIPVFDRSDKNDEKSFNANATNQCSRKLGPSKSKID